MVGLCRRRGKKEDFHGEFEHDSPPPHVGGYVFSERLTGLRLWGRHLLFRRPETNPGIKISDKFAHHRACAVAGLPPMIRIIIPILERDDADPDFVPERFFEQQPGSSGMRAKGHDIDGAGCLAMLVKPPLDREGGMVSPIGLFDEARYRNHIIR